MRSFVCSRRRLSIPLQPSSVACATTGEKTGLWNVVLFDKSLAFLGLVIPGRGPFHVEDFFFRPDEFLRLAVTFQAPLHLKRHDLHRKRHQVYAAMTGRTAHALVNVNAVVEIDEVGQVMDPRPLNRLPRPIALAHGLKEWAVGKNLRVAIHAGLRRRDAGESRRFYGGVTIAAVDAFIADVMLVAELNRLLAREVGLRVVGGPSELRHKPERYADEEYRAEDTQPGNDVCAAMKYLAHYFLNPGCESANARADSARRSRRAGRSSVLFLRGLQGVCAHSSGARLPEPGMIWNCPTDLNTVA
jgi:hypothetical protein